MKWLNIDLIEIKIEPAVEDHVIDPAVGFYQIGITDMPECWS